MSRKVLYQGKRTEMVVEGRGKMWVVPFVCQTHYEMGVGVKVFPEKNSEKPAESFFWGLVCPQNLFNFWRAVVILESLPAINHFSLAYCYYAGNHKLHPSDQHYRDEIVDLIGEDKMADILQREIPEDILEIFFELEDPMLAAVTAEVEEGTLKWQEKFSEMGVTHPEETKRKFLAEQRLLEKYENRLEKFSKKYEKPRDCLLMCGIESIIVTSYEKGIEERFGEKFVFAFSVILASAECRSFLNPFLGEPLSEEQHREKRNEIVRVETDKYVKLLGKNPFKRKAAKKYLLQIFSEWDDLPRVKPL